MKYLFVFIVLFSCATRRLPPACPEATETTTLSKKAAASIQGKVSSFLTDAQISPERSRDSELTLWRFKNMPEDSVYYTMGLREGDAITKTNLGEQKSLMNLISDLSGVATGVTNCLYVTAKDQSQRVIRVELKKD